MVFELSALLQFKHNKNTYAFGYNGKQDSKVDHL